MNYANDYDEKDVENHKTSNKLQ